MKKYLILAMLLPLVGGCSKSSPPAPAPVYQLEVLEVQIPADQLQAPEGATASSIIQHSIELPDAQTNRFLLNLAPDIPAKSGHTEITPMVSDSIPFDGEGKILKKPYKIGMEATATLLGETNGLPLCHIGFYRRKLTGFKEVTLANGKEVSIPEFQAKVLKTDTTLIPNEWVILGEIATRKNKDGTESASLIAAKITDYPADQQESP